MLPKCIPSACKLLVHRMHHDAPSHRSNLQIRSRNHFTGHITCSTPPATVKRFHRAKQATPPAPRPATGLPHHLRCTQLQPREADERPRTCGSWDPCRADKVGVQRHGLVFFGHEERATMKWFMNCRTPHEHVVNPKYLLLVPLPPLFGRCFEQPWHLWYVCFSRSKTDEDNLHFEPLYRGPETLG